MNKKHFEAKKISLVYWRPFKWRHLQFVIVMDWVENNSEGVIGRVIWNYKQDHPWIVRHEVLLPINCVNNKMRETF